MIVILEGQHGRKTTGAFFTLTVTYTVYVEINRALKTTI